MSIRADETAAAEYHAAGWWGDDTVATLVGRWADQKPDADAFVMADGRFTWSEYHQRSGEIATVLAALGHEPGERVAVILPDGPAVHCGLVGVEKAGLVAVGIGSRAGDQEIAHLMALTGATTLVTLPEYRGRTATHQRAELAAAGVAIRSHVLVDRQGGVVAVEGERQPGPAPSEALLPLGPDELFLLNSTSGTTGLPKCVMHTQNRWYYFHLLAAEAGAFGDDEVFMGAVPAPFGFGLWTSHFTPAILGAPTVVMERFDAGDALDLVERERVTVLCCVSTQFIMMLNANGERPRKLDSLRSMFTGGEAVPFERAADFEDTTGARVLQFYGSNETGALSRTTVLDDRDHRFGTAGRVIDEMQVRLLDPETLADVPSGIHRGQPACKGPATCLGYWGDDAANKKLLTDDGWMLMGDIVEIDDDGYLSVVGRTSDFIIRGGKNISAPAVEAELATHPAVAMVAAVAFPDPVFGERVCAYVEPRAGEDVTLDSLVAHLAARGVSREWYPEHLVVVDELPRSSGGKVAKGDLKEDARRRAAELAAGG